MGDRSDFTGIDHGVSRHRDVYRDARVVDRQQWCREQWRGPSDQFYRASDIGKTVCAFHGGEPWSNSVVTAKDAQPYTQEQITQLGNEEVPDMHRVPISSRIPIDERWLAAVSEPDELGRFVSSTRPWDREPVSLPVRVTAALWCIVGANVLVGCWAAALLTRWWQCSGIVCSLTTFGSRPGLLLILTSTSVLATVVMALLTGGLTRANGWQLAVLMLAAVVGVGCLLGPLLVLTIAAVAVGLACLSVLFLVERL
jgi:hypothetical protein